MRTGLLAVGGWLAAAAVTVTASWWAVSVVGGAVAPRELAVSTDLPAPDESVSARPSASAAPSGRPSAPGSGTAAGTTVSRSGTGGTVFVRCVDGRPRMTSTANQGFAIERDNSGAEVKFSSAGHRTEFKASCAGSVPSVSVEEKDESRGGGRDHGGG